MKTIWKYTLKPVDEQTIYVPIGYKILSVKNQKEQIVVYFLIDDPTTDILMSVSFMIIGTGNTIENKIDDYSFLDTVSLYDDSLMFHVFYKS